MSVKCRILVSMPADLSRLVELGSFGEFVMLHLTGRAAQIGKT